MVAPPTSVQLRPKIDLLRDMIDRAGSAQGWLCDMDGTLADTMGLHFRSYATVLARYGGLLTRTDFDRLVGPPATVTIPLFMRAAGLDESNQPSVSEIHSAKKSVFAALVDAGEMVALPMAHLVAQSDPALAIAIVTSANRAGALVIVDALGIASRIAVIVTGEDVARGKPAPDPYVLGLNRLGLTAGECLAFEDHADGIASARSADLRVIDVAHLVLHR